jgi:hypothetical protein
MPTASLFNPALDLTGSVSRHWTAITISSDRLVYEANGQQLIVQGTFTTGALGEVTGGTATTVVWKESANIETASLRVADLSLDAKALAGQVALATNDSHVFSFLLSGNDTLTGSAAGDRLQGFWGNDTINAGAGDDYIAEGAGNDTIDGGVGFDIVGYSGKLADYVIERTTNGFKVTLPIFSTDGSRPAESDQLSNVERLYFSDKHIALINADSSGGQVFRMYQAAFDRAPDEAGMDFWTMQLDSKGITLEAFAYGFILSQEYQKLYGSSLSNHDLVAKYYEHILHRTPDAGGLAFWSGVLDGHAASQAQVLAAISESPENLALSITLIGNGVVMDPVLVTI